MKADIDLLFLLKCQTIWHFAFFICHKLNFSPLKRSQATFFMNKANRRDRSQSDNLKIKGHLPNITVFPSADFQIASVANHDLFLMHTCLLKCILNPVPPQKGCLRSNALWGALDEKTFWFSDLFKRGDPLQNLKPQVIFQARTGCNLFQVWLPYCNSIYFISWLL